MNWAWYVFYGAQLNMNEQAVRATSYGLMCDLIACFSIYNGLSEQGKKKLTYDQIMELK
jgi:hypothetical protein